MRMLRVLVLLLAVLTGISIAQSPEQLGNGWMFLDNVDPIDDTGLVAVVKLAHDHPMYSNDSALAFRCEGTGKQVVLFLDDYIGSDTFTDAIHRFDRAEPIETEWYVHEGEQLALFEDEAQAFLDSALAASNVAIRAFDFDDSDLTYQFDLQGLAQVTSRVPCFSQ